MQIERLRLKNFRCYDELDIDFEPRLTVIVGENGKGNDGRFCAAGNCSGALSAQL